MLGIEMKGALTALIISTVLNFWIGVGGVIYGKPVGVKPVNVTGCAVSDQTTSPYESTLLSTPAMTTLGPSQTNNK